MSAIPALMASIVLPLWHHAGEEEDAMNMEVVKPLAITAVIVGLVVALLLPPLAAFWLLLAGAIVGSIAFRVTQSMRSDSYTARGVISGAIFGLILGMLGGFLRAG